MDPSTPFKIKGNADAWPGRDDLWYTGPAWLESMDRQWPAAIDGTAQYVTVDLSNVDFVTLDAWVATMAIMERVLTRQSLRHLTVDLKGPGPMRLMPWDEYRRLAAHHRAFPETPRTDEFKLADRFYRVLRFLESLNTSGCLNGRGFPGNFGYLHVPWEVAILRRHFTGHPGHETVLLPLIRVDTRESCSQFFYPDRIAGWRAEMAAKRKDSPLFATKQLWRVFCHELALNIYEHTHAPGYMAIRITEAEDLEREWPRVAYPGPVFDHFSKLKAGFVELCVSDSGDGFAHTLRAAHASAASRPPNRKVPPFADSDILAFAFDELGTCKARTDCWASGRHGLGRILQMVSVYGGALVLRSGNCEVAYLASGSGFTRVPYRLGFLPTMVTARAPGIGSHLRVFLPLRPMKDVLPRNNPADEQPLPATFKPDKKHVQGFLVPVREALDQTGPCVGTEAFLRFRDNCERLATRLVNERGRREALVFDFSGARDWSVPQYESFLTWMGNVLSDRQALLIEVDADMAATLDVLQFSKHPSEIPPEVVEQAKSVTGKAAALGENEFLGGLRTVLLAVPCVDSRGGRHIFGLEEEWCVKLLLDVVEHPKSKAKIEEGRSAEELAVLSAIFHSDSPLVKEEDGLWRTKWTDETLKVERERAVTVHFDQVAARCEAWRGRDEPMAFYLPFHDVWYREFLETSRILSRQRQADEIALLLLYRLHKRLERDGGSLEHVGMLAAATGPALLLATALHRMWPHVRRPAVADLGNYQMSGRRDRWPVLKCKGKLVIVQDVFDEGLTSGELARSLTAQKIDVLCCIGLGRFVAGRDRSGPTQVDEWWDDLEGLKPMGLSAHALLEIPRKPQVTDCDHNTPGAHWIEPRSLRAFRYSTLRREGADDEERRDRSRPLFTPVDKRIICAGHYVMGGRHHGIALDIRKAIKGPIGRQVARWIASLCVRGRRPRQPWESSRGYRLDGTVTAVLIPLHSQIHYLWPEIEKELAIVGKRVPVWLLDSTLFLGHGPACRLPYQFQQQIVSTIKEIEAVKHDKRKIDQLQLRLLILDDAIVSGVTAETLLGEVHRLVQKIIGPEQLEKNNIRPIKWIRYFTLFNCLGEGKHRHWRGLKQLGIEAETDFVFEEYHSVVGMPIHEADHCPICLERQKLARIATEGEFRRAVPAVAWANSRMVLLQPLAIDGPDFHAHAGTRLPKPIELCTWSAEGADTAPFRCWYADEAILRFYELMYLSYPVSDLLPCLEGMAALGGDAVPEYARFRWAVFDWCLRHWSRLHVDAARAGFVRYVRAEIEAESPLACPLLAGMAEHRDDPVVREFVLGLFESLAESEAPRTPGANGTQGGSAAFLDDILTVFLLAIPPESLRAYRIKGDVGVLDHIQMLSRTRVHAGVLTFTNNIYLRFGKSHRYAEPGWAMHVVAETLFRERTAKPRSHRLLLKLLDEVREKKGNIKQNRRLLVSTLGNFVGALDELEAVVPAELLSSSVPRELAKLLIGELRGAEGPTGDAIIARLAADLVDVLQDGKAFCNAFEAHFQVTVDTLRTQLLRHRDETVTSKPTRKFLRLRLDVEVEPGIERWSMLTNFDRLQTRLANWAIDSAVQRAEREFNSARKPVRQVLKSRIVIAQNPVEAGPTSIRVRVLSSWASPSAANKATREGRNFERETQGLRMFSFDTIIEPTWVAPTAAEKAEGFSAACDFWIPRGYTIKET